MTPASWNDAISALRERHWAVVKAMLPAFRRERYRRRLTQRDMAELLGISESRLAGFETGYRIPSPPVFSRWRDLLGL